MAHKNRELLFLLLALSFSGCLGIEKSGPKKSSQASIPLNAVLVAAFQKSFYTFARQNCAACHGNSQVPQFALTDVNSSYQNAVSGPYMNFTNVAQSMFAKYADNGHCGLPSCSGNGATAQAQLQIWADAVLAANSSNQGSQGGSGGSTGGGTVVNAPKYLTVPLTFPSPLPAAPNYVPMRWTLSNQMQPTSTLLNGAVLELEVELLSATSYHVRYPKIVGTTAPVDIAGIHVLVKKAGDPGIGVETAGAGDIWDTITVTAQPSPLPKTLPTAPFNKALALDPNSLVLGVISVPTTDQLAVGFDNIQPGGTLVTLMPTYSSISKLILQPKCVGCHKAGSAAGGADLSSYATVATQLTPGNPATSLLYMSVTATSAQVPNLMPKGGAPLSAAEKNAISTWITNGALNN
jgi:hypothetical protein